MATESVRVNLTSAAASNTTLTGYYSSVVVTNMSAPGATGAGPIWVRADGTTATSGGDGCFVVDPGTSLVLNNGTIWDQGLLNVPAGTIAGGTPWTPAYNSPFGTALNGAIANPGTTVSVIADSSVASPSILVAIESND